jgi:hypothetical protein
MHRHFDVHHISDGTIRIVEQGSGLVSCALSPSMAPDVAKMLNDMHAGRIRGDVTSAMRPYYFKSADRMLPA